MAHVTLIRDTAPSLLPMKRTPGQHISPLITQLQVALGHFDPQDKDNIAAVFELGNALEHAIVERLAMDDPDRYDRPGEVKCDGLIGTPDLFDYTLNADTEIKCTWASTKHGPGSKKFWGYECQMKCYCYMSGWTKSVLHVCFLNGNYLWNSATWGPQWRTWEYQFTEMELAQNWKMILKQAAKQRE